MTVTASFASRHSPWRHLPLGIILWLVVTVAVNAAMIFYAMNSFPGAVGDNAFDISNSYDRLTRNAEQQARLGWLVVVESADARPIVHAQDRAGAALGSAIVSGMARRPVGPAQQTALTFARAPDGRFVANAALAGVGQWDLSLLVEQDGKQLRVTRRLVLR
jgi:nitrogen fixation protein FixH